MTRTLLVLAATAAFAAPALAGPVFNAPGRGSGDPLPSYSMGLPAAPARDALSPPSIPAGTGPIRVCPSTGGGVKRFQAWVAELRASGRRVIVVGACDSAAALVMALPNACATGRASFRVHEAWSNLTGLRDEAVTAEILNSYPAAARDIIARKGGLTRKLITIPGRAVLPPC